MSLSLLDKNLLITSDSRVVKREDFERLVAAHDVLVAARESAVHQQEQLVAMRLGLRRVRKPGHKS
jgi:hypothetical protein